MGHDLQRYVPLLNSLNTHQHIAKGKQLHLLFLKKGVLSSTITIANRFLQMYSRCGHVTDARTLFEEMHQRNCFTWNAMLECYVKFGYKNESLQLFYSMPERDDFSWNVVISGFAKSGKLDVARKLFNEMPKKNGIAWNAMIHGYTKHGCQKMALRLFKDLANVTTCEIGGNVCLDTFVLATVLGICADLGGFDQGKQVHARMVVDGVQLDTILGSSLVNMYGKCGDVDSAVSVSTFMGYLDDFSLSALISGYAKCGRMNDVKRIFDLRTDPCVVIWNSMIAGYIFNGKVMEALLLFQDMHQRGMLGDSSTFSSVLSACARTSVLENVRQMHALIYKIGLMDDLIAVSSLVDAYAKCGSPDLACSLFRELEVHDTILLNSMITIYSNCGHIDEARRIFDAMPSKSMISWNAMIVGLTQNACPIEALDFFRNMNKMNLSVDRFSLASVISACASISSVKLGEQLFARATIVGLDGDHVVSTSLIDFYCKCGFVRHARNLFDQATKTDTATWNSMLMGYATNGYGIEALNLFSDMCSAGVEPTGITFTSVLSACDHCGLLEQGWKWFYAMKHDYHIDPGIEHYSCMVDLFARAGYLNEALNLILEMPFKADASMWLSILRGCVAHGDKALGQKVACHVMQLDGANSDVLVQLSSMFAGSGDWESSALVRNWIRSLRFQKNPGRSWSDI